jgi:hypothetical protein
MMRVLLCAGPGLLVIQKDGLLFYRRPGQPDTPVPYAPEHYSVFLRSAKEKHGLTPGVGPNGEEAPCLPEEPALPKLRRERLPSGEEVYRLVSSVHEPSVQKPSGDKQSEQAGLPTAEKTPEFGVCKVGWSSTRPGCWRRRSWPG